MDVDSRDPHAKPYIHETYMKTWRQMEKLVGIGAGAAHRHFQHDDPQTEAGAARCRDQAGLQRNGVAPALPAAGAVRVRRPTTASFRSVSRPIGSPTRPDRDRTPDDTVDIEDPVIVRIAERLNVHPAVVCVKWAVQRGQVPIPFSVARH